MFVHGIEFYCLSDNRKTYVFQLYIKFHVFSEHDILKQSIWDGYPDVQISYRSNPTIHSQHA